MDNINAERVIKRFKGLFPTALPKAVISVPGRTELGGNHTDHQGGCVLAGSVKMEMLAAASPINNNEVYLHIRDNRSYRVVIDISQKTPLNHERGLPASLVRGVAAGLSHMGYRSGGFEAYIESVIPIGIGVSSSAAFEILIGCIFSCLYNGGDIPVIDLAKAGQWAENRFYGKPCGLMDQLACAHGGIALMDFNNVEPHLASIPNRFADSGYQLCLVNTGTGHENLTDEYARIPADMERVARALGAQRLRDVKEEDYLKNGSYLRSMCGDRAFLRAMHFFGEMTRVGSMASALIRNDFQRYLELVEESGRSSAECLQNTYSICQPDSQPLTVGLSLSQRALGEKGVCRIHGGGFAGAIQAYVPLEIYPQYQLQMERVFGAGCCIPLELRDEGIVRVF